MAIDDNTKYGLTGAQIKDLAEKVKNAGGVKVLTTADYNWPVAIPYNPNGIALWLLDEGIYSIDDASVKVYSSSSGANNNNIGFYFVGAKTNNEYVPVVYFNGGVYSPITQKIYLDFYDIVSPSTVNRTRTELIGSRSIINNLTSTSTDLPLSAAQGKALKDMIDAIPTSEAIHTLTTDDYNHPASNPTSVAFWKLADGFYDNKNNVQITPDASGAGAYDCTVYVKNAGGGVVWVTYFNYISGSDLVIKRLDSSNGSVLSKSQTSIIEDSLTSTSTSKSLSANQGKVLKDMIDALPTGGVVELTEADYNWPESNPTRIALWLLPAGIYRAEGNVNVSPISNTSADNFKGIVIVRGRNDIGTSSDVIVFSTALNRGYYSINSTGGTSFIRDFDKAIVNSLGSEATDLPLAAAQGKALKGMIDAIPAGGVKVLTTADYNWPTTGTKTSVALWLLEPGIYTPDSSNVQLLISSQGDIISPDEFGIVTKEREGSDFNSINILKAGSEFLNSYVIRTDNGSAVTRYVFLSRSNITDSLTSTSTINALSANQGKVLKDELDKRIIFGGTTAPTTSTVGQVSSLYVCVINMVPKMYICTAVSGSTYTWTEFSAGPTPEPEPEIDPEDQSMVLPTSVPVEDGEADLTGTNASFDEDNTLKLGD